MALLVVAGLSAAIWFYLFFFRGRFWRMNIRLGDGSDVERVSDWPSVVAIVPARNETEVLRETLPALLQTEYQGSFRVILIDDESTDGTGALAGSIGRSFGAADRLTVIRGETKRRGWRGKVWAMAQGVRAAKADRPTFVLFADADIKLAPTTLTSLVLRAQTESLDLVSVMAHLRLDTAWDRLLIPAFVYFFAKLYPFRWSNNPRRRTAAAAGGCALVRLERLRAAGGVERMASAVIDDCALARLIKRSGGRLWLGLCKDVKSVRRNGTLRKTWDMVARSAYAQLGYSRAILACTVFGMIVIYVVPWISLVMGFSLPGFDTRAPFFVLFSGLAILPMLASYTPTVRTYDLGARFLFALPVAATLYTLMTVSSAWRVWRGRPTQWKGREIST